MQGGEPAFTAVHRLCQRMLPTANERCDVRHSPTFGDRPEDALAAITLTASAGRMPSGHTPGDQCPPDGLTPSAAYLKASVTCSLPACASSALTHRPI